MGGRSDVWCPQGDSNARTRLRRPVLYPLSYGGKWCWRSQCSTRASLPTRRAIARKETSTPWAS